MGERGGEMRSGRGRKEGAEEEGGEGVALSPEPAGSWGWERMRLRALPPPSRSAQLGPPDNSRGSRAGNDLYSSKPIRGN